jgi:signal transduction histidine kinase/CheY-like chemotaxis protein
MMLRPRLGSFRARIAFTATAIAVLVGATITAVTVIRSSRGAREALQREGFSSVRHLAEDIAPELAASDRDAVSRTARAYLLALPNVVSTTVYRGRVPFAFAGERPSLGGPIPAIAAKEFRWSEVADGVQFQAPVLQKTSASGEPEVVGVAEIVLSLSQARAQLRTTVILNAALLAVGIALAVVLSAWGARRLALPVQELMRAAEQVGQGRLDLTVPVHAQDELGRLADTFNRMVRDLRSAAQERLQTEQELRGHARALREADQRKNDFLAMLAHELRNPLAPIGNAAFVLSRAPTGEPARRALEALQRQVRHMGRLVDDLLDVSRIQRGKIALRRARMDLADVTRKAVEDLRHVFDEAEVALVLELPEGPLTMEGDETRLTQVLGNLLQNAAKFTEPGGRTTVSLRAVAGRAQLRVRDSGAGMDPSIRARLFQPFEQADRTLARSSGGLGLGLSLVKGIVDLHGGTIEARSDGPGRGSEFVVELPTSEGVPTSAAARSAEAPSASSLRVLVVEDNADAADVLRLAIEMDGHVVDVARDGDEGVAKAGRFSPQVVLCDIGLPGRSGYDVARALRKDGTCARAVLVAVTGYTNSDDVREAFAAGFDHHLPKPASMDGVRRILEEAARAGGAAHGP